MTLEQAIITVKQHAEQCKDNLCLVYANDGRYLVKLHKDGDKFLPTCQYKRMVLYDKGYAPEFLWTITDTVQFVQTFINCAKTVLSIVQKRKYGEPKLTKPKELKGLKGVSIDFIPKKCKFQYFEKDNDLYILCRDFFSPTFRPPIEDAGMPLSVIVKKYFGTEKHCKNFVYPDTWGSVVLRAEAWLRLSNYKLINERSKNHLECRTEFKKIFVNGLLQRGYIVRENDTYWQHFIENLCDTVYRGCF